MRFASAQFLALFEDDLWLRSASHANAMAARLRAGLEASLSDGRIDADKLSFSQATQANAVFAILDPVAADNIRHEVRFYDWGRARGEVRWMTAFDTTEEDVELFVEIVVRELNRLPTTL